MPLLVPPQMLNTMDEQDLWGDPVRRYMLPPLGARPGVAEPSAVQRDSLHERDMWAVEGLTHRYPTKVLIELCPRARSTAGTARGWISSDRARSRS